MKVYLDPPPNLGRAIHRVALALKDYAPPWVQVVSELEHADLQIVHALGDGERLSILRGLEAGTQRPYSVVAYCVRTTETPNTADWVDVWGNAELAWSYYDLRKLVYEDSGNIYLRDNLYYAPLGVDATIFRPQSTFLPTFLVGTSGYVAATEGIPEWAAVLAAVDRPGFHLGPRLKEHDHRWICESSLTDQEVATRWSQCRYVAAMRRIEGFELPGVEALLCGSRPICFDRPHYRFAYGEHAEYVEEAAPNIVIEQLLDLLQRPYRPVEASEIQWARERFNWESIIGNFWKRMEHLR